MYPTSCGLPRPEPTLYEQRAFQSTSVDLRRYPSYELFVPQALFMKAFTAINLYL